jgi:opacity protein-like surface antigen
MNKLGLTLGAAFAAAALAMPAQAQMMESSPLSLEVRGGAAFPSGDFADIADTGWGFGANAGFELTPLVGVYGGYDRYSFSPESDLLDGDYVSSGFNGGLRVTPMLSGMNSLSPWLRGGVVYNKLQFDFDEFDEEDDSDFQLGFEVGGGIELPLGQRVSITPGLRYTSYSLGENTSTDVFDRDVDINTFVADVGLKFRF